MPVRYRTAMKGKKAVAHTQTVTFDEFLVPGAFGYVDESSVAQPPPARQTVTLSALGLS